jgi:hypothetical protein
MAVDSSTAVVKIVGAKANLVSTRGSGGLVLAMLERVVVFMTVTRSRSQV